VDHNLLQTDERNMADHLFLRSACRRFGLWYSKPGNGVSHDTDADDAFGFPADLLAVRAGAVAAGLLPPGR
jgi:aconitate hydratase